MSDEAPKEVQDADRWWQHILWQSWIGLFGLIAYGVALVWMQPETGMAHAIVAAGLVGASFANGGGTTLIRFAKAWRGNA